MPSLIRFLLVVGVLAGIVWGAMEALAILVEPTTRPMSQAIPPNRLTAH